MFRNTVNYMLYFILQGSQNCFKNVQLKVKHWIKSINFSEMIAVLGHMVHVCHCFLHLPILLCFFDVDIDDDDDGFYSCVLVCLCACFFVL